MQCADGMIHLEELYLNNNHLTSIPEILAELPKLKRLSLSNNHIKWFPINIDKVRTTGGGGGSGTGECVLADVLRE